MATLPKPWGWDLKTIRWCGILQRIAFAYFVVGLTTILIPARPAKSTLGDVLRVYAWEWLSPALFALLYLALMLATPVPDWHVADTPISIEKQIANATIFCHGVKGDLGPACNAAGYYDRLLFGQEHLYQPGEKVCLPFRSCGVSCRPTARRPLALRCVSPNAPLALLARAGRPPTHL